MRISKGIVVDGHVIVEGESLDEGAIVTVLISDEGSIYLRADDEAELLEAIAEADRGNLVDGDDVIRKIS